MIFTKRGAFNSTIIASTGIGAGGNGSYNWPIPNGLTPGIDYTIVITSTTNAAYTDTSDAPFTITAPPASPIMVTSPNGGENWARGATQTITWTYTGNPGNLVKIELLKGGVLNRTIVSVAYIGTGGSGSYNWKIPTNQTVGTDYTIRITSRTNNSISDTSDNFFTIN